MSLQAVEEHGPVPLLDLDELPDDGLLMPCGGLGAPTVSIEKVGNGAEGARLREYVERLWGKPGVALMSAQNGGSNRVPPGARAPGPRPPRRDAGRRGA